ncbi:peroxiredoxin family protein [Paenibacillus sp. GCM10012307]|uniref:TlpA family protein disulfide reductase n=1 Tax=Paenibacillus roseus TaxID=2798579 RepID=A0A934J4C6_9BACL|nr:TlpA disulfide reductase family protein [Paenibacillus roseus]MBJ6360185.1 TlpA family protein disulfide reductase [Paenibacillus roseus]
MKKYIWIWGAIALFLGLSIYVTNNYSITEADGNESASVNRDNAAAKNSEPESPDQSSDTAGALSSSETSSQAAGAKETNKQSGGSEAITAEDDEDLETAVDFTLTDLDGNPVTLSDYRGKGVYLNFWATWCKWCRKEMPDMEKVYREYKDKDFVMLAISIGEEKETVEQFIRDTGYSFNVLLDPDKSVSREYGIKPIPVSLFIDREGRIVFRKLGTMNEEQMRERIEQILK